MDALVYSKGLYSFMQVYKGWQSKQAYDSLAGVYKCIQEYDGLIRVRKGLQRVVRVLFVAV